MLEWHPTHLRHVLSEEMVIEAWLKDRLHAGVRLRATGDRRHDLQTREGEWADGEHGPPLYEADGRREWQADDSGPCRVRVGLRTGGSVCTQVRTAGGGIEYTGGTRRMAARGIREWRDVTHPSGRWLTWNEAMKRFPGLSTDADRKAYDRAIAELEESRWARVRERWWRCVQEGRAAVEEVRDAPTTYEVKRVHAARRMPKRGESTTGWEVLIEWADEAHRPACWSTASAKAASNNGSKPA